MKINVLKNRDSLKKFTDEKKTVQWTEMGKVRMY